MSDEEVEYLREQLQNCRSDYECLSVLYPKMRDLTACLFRNDTANQDGINYVLEIMKFTWLLILVSKGEL